MKIVEMQTKNHDHHGDLSVKNMNRNMGLKEWGLILILSVIWGGSFFFIEIAVSEMTPLTIVLCWVGFAAVILMGYVHLSGRRMPASLHLWGAFLIMGALNNLIPFSLIVWGQKHIDSSLAYIIYFRVLATAGATNLLLVTFLIPVSAILLGVLVLGERPGWNAFGGMSLIFVGLMVLDGRFTSKIKIGFTPIYAKIFEIIGNNRKTY